MVLKTGLKIRSCFAAVATFALLSLLISSCSRKLGYGVLLWSNEDPPIPSGTVLPVYIRSNIDQVWVAGIPKEFMLEGMETDKFEIPLSKLELSGSRSKAEERAAEFAPYALTYAETLQDGLPIREHPENNARRVYRLKQGEIIKIISQAQGVAAVGASGDPLPGNWFKVLTEDGVTGFCFSYRLKLFEHSGGPLEAIADEGPAVEDPDLDTVLSKKWSPEEYGQMVASGKIDLEKLSRGWKFDPGQDSGIARVFIDGLDRSFAYTAMRPAGKRTWRFEGSTLQVYLRNENTLSVQFTENGGALRSLVFTAMPVTVEDLIEQETTRRAALYNQIFTTGPEFTSSNYGTIVFMQNGRFTWNGFDFLVPDIIPAQAAGAGTVEMRLFLGPQLAGKYSGAFTLRFDGQGGAGYPINFLYSLDSGDLRLEYAPPTSLDDISVSRRSSSPMVIYFYKNRKDENYPGLFSPSVTPPASDITPPPDVNPPPAAAEY